MLTNIVKLTTGSSSFSSSSLNSSSAPNFKIAFNSSRLNGVEFEPGKRKLAKIEVYNQRPVKTAQEKMNK